MSFKLINAVTLILGISRIFTCAYCLLLEEQFSIFICDQNEVTILKNWVYYLIFLTINFYIRCLVTSKKVTCWYNETWIAFKTHIEIILSNHLWQFIYIHYYNDNINVGNLIMVTYNEVTSIWSHVVHLVCLGRNSSNFQALILTLRTPLLCQCTLD